MSVCLLVVFVLYTAWQFSPEVLYISIYFDAFLIHYFGLNCDKVLVTSML